MARKLIWPLWSSHIFTQWGWLILFNLDHSPRLHKNGESPPNYLFLRIFQAGRTYFFSAPFIATESQHHEESRLIYGPFESTLLNQGFPVEHELDACNPPHTGTPLCRPLTFAISAATRKRSDVQLLHFWAAFSGDFHASLLQQPGPHIYEWLHHSRPYTANTTFSVSIATHILLRHSALPWK